MVKSYIMLLVGCTVYLNGAAPEDVRKSMLKKWAGGQKNLSDLSDGVQDVLRNQDEDKKEQEKYLEQALEIHTRAFGKPGAPQVLDTPIAQKEAQEARTELLGIGLILLRKGYYQAAEQVMYLVGQAEFTYQVFTYQDGPSPRKCLLWEEIREKQSRKDYKNNTFYQLAKQEMKNSENIKKTSRVIMDLSKDAFEAHDDEMARILALVRLAFVKEKYEGQLDDNTIDGLFKKAAVYDPKMGGEGSPRTQEILSKINATKKARAASLQELF